jgi:hypothetical protein
MGRGALLRAGAQMAADAKEEAKHRACGRFGLDWNAIPTFHPSNALSQA